MYRNYFEYNGKKYYTGAVLLIHYRDKKNTEATFVCYDIDNSRFVLKVNNHKLYAPDKWFWEVYFIDITNKIDTNVRFPVKKRRPELEIDGMLNGWAWYIVLMLLSAFFKDAVGLWAFISLVFFTWRSDKINKEGTYVEW